MKTHYDGGRAFPTFEFKKGEDAWTWLCGGGMTLRDWFAGQALAKLADRHGIPSDTKEREELLVRISTQCYALADAMLEAREE